MPELKTPAGKVVELDADAINAKFDAAMNDDTPEESAPPKREKTVRSTDETPKPRTSRTPKAEKARTTKAAAPVDKDFTEDAQTLVSTVWTVAASLPPAQPYAFALAQSADALIPALADAAKHSAFIRGIVSGGGGNAWQLKLAAAGMQFGMTALSIMRDPEMRKQAAEATRSQLAEAMRVHGLQVADDVPAAA